MAIPVYALGADPHLSAPLFYANKKKLAQGIKRNRIKQIGQYFYRQTLANFVPGSRPQYEEVIVADVDARHEPDCQVSIRGEQENGKKVSCTCGKLPHAELPGLKFQQTDKMKTQRVLSELAGIPSQRFLPRQEIRANLNQ